MLRWFPVLPVLILGIWTTSCNPMGDRQLSHAPPAPAPTLAGDIAVTSDSSRPERKPPESCPVTRPPNPPFVPPPPYPSRPPGTEQFWYGTDQLWTLLRVDGTWYGLPHTEAGYTQKVVWWQPGYNGRDDPTPKLTVTGKRLDAPAPPLVASRATNAFHPDFNWAMLVGVDVPTLGCWEITGNMAGRTLSFVVWVAP